MIQKMKLIHFNTLSKDILTKMLRKIKVNTYLNLFLQISIQKLTLLLIKKTNYLYLVKIFLFNNIIQIKNNLYLHKVGKIFKH